MVSTSLAGIPLPAHTGGQDDSRHTNSHKLVAINKISADIFQSENLLAYIVIHTYLAILQTPISHYCNTLTSPILQIAIYL